MHMPEPSELIQQLQAHVAALEQENAALWRSESRYRQCFENAPVSLIINSAEGEPIEMNAAAEQFLGWTIAQSKAADFNLLADPVLIENGTATSFQRAIAGETVIEPPMSFDPSSTIGRGQWKWAQGHYYPLRDETGQVQEIVELALDLTPMYEVQQRLAAERDRAIQSHIAELEAQNRLLESRDRILEANVAATQALLTTENLDEAVNAALQIIGEVLEFDRVGLLENFEHPSEPLPCWRYLYEWTAPGTVSQLSDSNLVCGTHEGMEAIYEQMNQGQTLSFLLEELPEPFRSGQASLGVKALHTIPVFVEGQFWGEMVVDDCRKAKRRCDAELAILKTAATCIGSLIQRDRAIQSHIAELEAQNRLLESRDRILEATASAANTLLTTQNLDEAVNTAFQILGEALNTDRVTMCENFAPAPDAMFPSYRMLYEWDSPQTVSQISHPVAGEGTYAEIEWLYELFQQGQSASYQIEDAPEPFRSEQIDIGVKSTHLVPIYIKGRWWGVLGLDDCREAKHRSPAELAVLKTAAVCIGSAIQRDRTQKAMLQAEQARSQELDRLNTELQQTLDRLTESENNFRTLFEMSSEGFYLAKAEPPISLALSIEEQCELAYQNIRVVDANPAFVAMYGADNLEDVIGMGNPDCHTENSEKNRAFIRGIVESGYCCSNLETEEIDRHGRSRYFLNNSFSIRKDGYFIGGWCTQTDITDLRIAQQALLQAEQQRAAQLVKANITLKKTLDVLATEPQLDRALGHVLQVTSEQIGSSSAALWLYHPDIDQFRIHLVYLEGRIIAAIPETTHLLTGHWIRGQNLSGDLMLKQHIRDRAPVIYDVDHYAEMPPGVRRFMNQLGVKTLLGIPLLLGSEIVGSFTIRFRDRPELQAEDLELTQALAHQATLAIQLLRMAEAAKTEAQQTTLLEERNRMARELHDTLAQTFTGVIVQLEAAQEMIAPTTAPVQKHLAHAGLLARQGLQEARRSVWSLRPEALESNNLQTALLRLVQQMTEHTAIATEVVVDGTPIALPEEIESHLLRIGQESLTNALKHTKAQHIQLLLQFTPTSIALRIMDDGQGFDPQQPRRGFGITCMQQRTQQIGGEFTLTSQIGQGTAIDVRIPVVQ
jgi:PAS domain S-box-containing protein